MVIGAKEAALSDTQDMATLLLEAEGKLGGMLAVIEPKYDYSLGSSGGTKPPPPRIKTLPSGITKKESHHARNDSFTHNTSPARAGENRQEFSDAIKSEFFRSFRTKAGGRENNRTYLRSFRVP